MPGRMWFFILNAMGKSESGMVVPRGWEEGKIKR